MYSEEQKQQVRRWWEIFRQPDGFVEVRILGNTTYSGIYKDVENLIRDLDLYGDNGSAYFIFNELDAACYEKKQREKMLSADFRGDKKLTTANDKEVKRYLYVYLDIDCEKVADVNSTDAEKEYAHQKAVAIYKYLQSCGFCGMTVCDSANGYHIFIPCDFAADKGNQDLVKRFIHAIAVMFNDERAGVDLKVFNPARLAKIPGSYSFKGSPDSVERPRRMGRVLSAPYGRQPNQKAYFEKVAAAYPEETITPDRYNNYSSQRFDLPAFIARHGIEVRKVEEVADGTRYILDHCLFDPNHKGRDAMLFQHRNGAIGYFCFHNSCASYKWRDVRLLYEPDAYDKKDYNEFQDRRRYNSGEPKTPEPIRNDEERGERWLNPSEIKYHNPDDDVHIPSGFEDIDRYMGGWCLPDSTVITGLPGGGKTSFLNMLILNAVQHGYSCACWSGELIPSRFMQWLSQAAAGLQYVVERSGYDDWYYAPKHVMEKVSKWLDGKFYLYDNNYGNNESQLFIDMESVATKKGVRLFFLDNLAAMNLDGSGELLEKQKEFINRVNEFTKRLMCHVIVVIHPRKEQGGGFVRMESIGGARELYGLASNAMVIHRINRDFEKRATEYLGSGRVSELRMYDGAVEVVKNRENGVQDKIFGLYYEKQTRRFKTHVADYVHYGWEDGEPRPAPVPTPQEPHHGWDVLPWEKDDDDLPL